MKGARSWCVFRVADQINVLNERTNVAVVRPLPRALLDSPPIIKKTYTRLFERSSHRANWTIRNAKKKDEEKDKENRVKYF